MTRQYDVDEIYAFLLQVDASFPVPLSQKQELGAYARKLWEKATICACREQGELVSMVAGYTDHLTDNLGYVAIAATAEQARGKGHAFAMMGDFLDICREKHIRAVHLYADKHNAPALALYRKLGFLPWEMEGEPRPEDAHLICYLGE